jgi:hypothetical protein
MKSNVAPQRKIVVNVFPGKPKQIKPNRRDVESSSAKDTCNCFYDLLGDAININVNGFGPIL